jgi:hypothetical protein
VRLTFSLTFFVSKRKQTAKKYPTSVIKSIKTKIKKFNNIKMCKLFSIFSSRTEIYKMFLEKQAEPLKKTSRKNKKLRYNKLNNDNNDNKN